MSCLARSITLGQSKYLVTSIKTPISALTSKSYEMEHEIRSETSDNGSNDCIASD